MNDLTPQTPLDPPRALNVAAYDALIEVKLADRGEMLPGRAANRLLDQLVTTGTADVQPIADGTLLVMHGIAATSTGGANALLRNWQSAARDRLARGMRA